MTTAGIMLAHQVASKAFRDAAFLSAWPATALPGLTLATAALVLALVPIFSRLLARFSPLAVVSAGFAVSAVGHAAEWSVYDAGPDTCICARCSTARGERTREAFEAVEKPDYSVLLEPSFWWSGAKRRERAEPSLAK